MIWEKQVQSKEAEEEPIWARADLGRSRFGKEPIWEGADLGWITGVLELILWERCHDLDKLDELCYNKGWQLHRTERSSGWKRKKMRSWRRNLCISI